MVTKAARKKSKEPKGARIVFIPSVSGGLGHITRTLRLAAEIERRRPDVQIEYIVDQERLRPVNLEFIKSTRYPVQVMPARNRDQRDIIVRALLGEADLVVDDNYRHFIPYRRIIRARWISIPMLPLWDELFMDWPLLEQVDRVLWTYPAAMQIPEELKPLGRKVLVTGPILNTADLPSRGEARRALGFKEGERVITYAPRGMPFGRDFGEKVLSGVVNGLALLRNKYPELRLILTGVQSESELRFPGMPEDLRAAAGLEVRGVVSPGEIRALTSGADAVIAEGTTTTFEAIAAGTPILMVPGSINETWRIGTQLGELDAAVILWTERVTPASVAEHLERILAEPARSAERVERARKFLGPDGAVRAAAEILRWLDKPK